MKGFVRGLALVLAAGGAGRVFRATLAAAPRGGVLVYIGSGFSF
jgi:hypothetical protein